ncbi:MAG TPA: hypothetical protein VI434_01020 [Candidatus Dormibacteraeota bacterium]
MPADDLRRSVTHLMQCFLDNALEAQFVIFENCDHEDEYVQFTLNNRILYAEVGSREWRAPDDCRPLDAHARSRLADLGFTHGGPQRNNICDNVAQSAPYLADLRLRLAVAAYEALPESLTVISNVEAVLELAGPFGRRPGCTARGSRGNRHKELQTTPVTSPSPGLQFRVERALRSNFAQIGTRAEELEALRNEVADVSSFDALSTWAQDWIRKAEEGPLWVVLGG